MYRTHKLDGQQGPSLLEIALMYYRRGWSIIPIKLGTKKPPRGLRWKRHQSERPDEARLKRWFVNREDRGLAVVLGAVSGGLVCRDFDVMETYERWAQEHPDLARTLPTVATGRPGRHVYFLSDRRGIVKLDDGELRGAGISLLPRTPHPKGTTYNWIVPLHDGPLPFGDDVQAAGFLSGPSYREYGENGDYGEYRGTAEENGAIDGGEVLSATRPDFRELQSDDDTKRLIAETLEDELRPQIGTRNNWTWPLGRALKAVPAPDAAGVRMFLHNAERWDRKQHSQQPQSRGPARGKVGKVRASLAQKLLDFCKLGLFSGLYTAPRTEK